MSWRDTPWSCLDGTMGIRELYWYRTVTWTVSPGSFPGVHKVLTMIPPSFVRASTVSATAAAQLRDPDVFRGMLEAGGCLALPEEVFSRPGFMDKVMAHAGARTWRPPGPDRAALLELVRA